MQLDGRPVTVAEVGALALHNHGHFTTMTVADGGVRGLRLHLDRLRDDCRTVFDSDLDPDRVRTLIRAALAGYPPGPRIVRVTVFDPDGGLSASAGRADRPRILVTTRPAATETPPAPLRLGSRRYQRDLPQVKHTGLFAAVHHRRRAQSAGFDDALFVDSDGRIGEGPTWNIGVVRDGEVVWPAGPCLPGVTMRLLTAAAGTIGLRCRSTPIAVEELDHQHGAFVTNAAIGLRPVAEVDGRPLAATPVVDLLGRAYTDVAAEPLAPAPPP
ncbi:aminotransferase class IV [Solwaraspora sp. WMMD406]|uniref:aminotransferase class IV n=1 Tax=Solwaraspora sp. WMMD406 TaxID=3016095 RepID=UPI002417E886|nr:aminotransferase class IV [Solwaraspora sp. WMMD406]MDG4765754.1 aminotransferase class IV [Solwaraspora sp. WMMD406]